MAHKLDYAQMYLITLAVCELILVGIILTFFNFSIFNLVAIRKFIGINLLILVGNLLIAYGAYFLYDNSVF